MKLQIGIIGICLFLSNNIYPQYQLSGKIYDSSNDQPLIGATLLVKESGTGTIANIEGSYSIRLLPGQYSLKISYLGYSSAEENVTIANQDIQRNFYLHTSAGKLNEVIVTGNGKMQEKRELPYQISILDTKPLQLQSRPVTGLVNQLSGVRVREDGGMGSNANIMLNGIGGKGIRIFVDDMPADLMGIGMAINNLPVNMIDHIEVYKGLVPAKFGSDALGGVLNLVLRNQGRDFIDASAGMGSFGTRQFTLNTRKYTGKDKNFYSGFSGFYNHSDNDYRMDNVDIVYDELGNTKKGRARRFNDAYTSYLGKITTGFRRLSWADDIRLNLICAYTNKEWQHGLTAETPWGEPFSKTSDVNADLQWKKYGILAGKLDINFMGGYGYTDFYFEDIAAKTYYWGAENGVSQWVSKATVGEASYAINGHNPHLFTHKGFTRLNTAYHVTRNHTLALTSLLSYTRMEGHDYRGIATFGADVFANPQTILKNYVGLSLESKFLQEKITNIVSGKNFYGKSKIAVLNDAYTFTGQQESSYNKFCFGDAIKYQLFKKLAFIINYEYTLRLPDTEELFGNFITIYPNAGLEPERSRNLDAGFRFHTRDSKFSTEINGFHRHTSDLIFLRTLLVYRSVYMNLQDTETWGGDFEIKYNPGESLSVFANATYQDIRLKGLSENSGLSERYIGNRIPNLPYMFANGGANYTLPMKTGKIQCFYTLNYVHDFFLTWEADGKSSTKTIIPEQVVHNGGVSYSFPRDKVSIAAECRNISNEKVYDNYSVQKPGRSFYLKIRYFFEK